MHEGPLAEFSALRLEIQFRNDNLWKAFNLQITVAGALFAFSLSNSSRAPFLLILPAISYMFATRHVLDLNGIYKAGEYIEFRLSPSIPGGLHWEQWMRSHRHSLRKWYLVILNPAILAFPGVAILALSSLVIWAITAEHKPLSPPLSVVTYSELAAWTLDLLLTILMFRSIYGLISDRYKKEHVQTPCRYIKRHRNVVITETVAAGSVVKRSFDSAPRGAEPRVTRQ